MAVRASRHLETTEAIVITCHRCLRPVIYGIAEGIAARVDAVVLDQAAEIAAVLARRQTYTLRRSGLIRRDATRRSDPDLTGPVVAEHNCPRSNT